MIANYHTHTWRCGHASGTEREYIETAIGAGTKILGFSDHTPYPFPNGYGSRMRMRTDQIEDYVTTILSLKKEYEEDIEIHLGFETEYYPDCFPALLELYRPYPIEYLILGQHHAKNEYDGWYNGAPTKDPYKLSFYVDQCIAAMDTGKFLYIAHPDLIHFTGEDSTYEQEMRRLLAAMKERHIPAEINFYGLMDHRNYPDPRFWRLAGETGVDVVFGNDAHMPEMNNLSLCEKQAEAMVSRYHLHHTQILQLPQGGIQ